jgi:hypothetical protein
MKRLTMAALGAAMVLGLAATAQAQVVVRDAQTGQLRAPTAAEAEQLHQLQQVQRGRAMNRGLLTGTLNPRPVRMRDGSDFLENTEADMNYSVMVRLPDGRLARQCVGDAEMAERVVRGEMPTFAKNLLERLNER